MLYILGESVLYIVEKTHKNAYTLIMAYLTTKTRLNENYEN